MSNQPDLSDQEFIAVNHRTIAKLQRKHPESPGAEVIQALRQAQGRMDHASSDQILAAASKVLAKVVAKEQGERR